MSGEQALLGVLALVLLLRAAWLSAQKHQHLAWISAAGGALVLAGALLNDDRIFLPGIVVMVVGEFLHQTNSEIPPQDRSESS
ncbi:hypothetical protein [Kribbella sp. CA-293567]|uniref:hypothetical protein n=1 Tax=Kribbella sp. CA-293567 TaxID=3002436 RepID=UPI0022DE9040|nr:hypothetical protein [Kribbella sp. CA-293567]WBQ04117.1 hypothetical protein OX958_29635 [Kribbella sp. CA-293567]